VLFQRERGGAGAGKNRMSATPLIELTIDGRKVAVAPGTTVFDAARVNGIAIPTLCHQQNETPVGVCRMCVVDVGARVFAASCVRPAESGMVVTTSSERVEAARHTLLELLMSDHPSPCARQQHSGDCELETLARAAGIGAAARRFFSGHRRGARRLHPLRSLHPRLRRYPQQFRSRANGQRRSHRHCV
jgi:NADH dehydrogenase/NADH:ubiquinone oxidoreductase subunit G